MGQEVTIPVDQHFAQYCNSLVPHNREEIGTLIDDISHFTSIDVSCSTSQNDNHSSTSTKGKEKVVCLGPSTPSPLSSSKDPKQSHYEEMDKLMKEFDRKCKLHHKGVGEYSISLFDPPLSLRYYGKLSSTNPYHAQFIKASETPLNVEEDISQQNIDILPLTWESL